MPIEQAMFLIKAFVGKEMVVLAYFKGDKWTGSQCVGADEPWRPPGAGEADWFSRGPAILIPKHLGQFQTDALPDAGCL